MLEERTQEALQGPPPVQPWLHSLPKAPRVAPPFQPRFLRLELSIRLRGSWPPWQPRLSSMASRVWLLEMPSATLSWVACVPAPWQGNCSAGPHTGSPRSALEGRLRTSDCGVPEPFLSVTKEKGSLFLKPH